MKVILTQPIEKLGNPGDIVTIADGYGRNYLLPRQLAIVADKGSLKQAGNIAAEHAKRDLRARTDAEALATRLRMRPVTVSARVGSETTKLYGSITSSDIAEAVRNQLEIDVDRRKIELDEPIRNIGEYDVPIRLRADVTAHVKVNVVPVEG